MFAGSDFLSDTPSAVSRLRTLPTLHAIAEITVLGTLHDRLRPRELDFRAADLSDVIVGLAEQKSPEFRFAEGAKEIRVSTSSDIELYHL